MHAWQQGQSIFLEIMREMKDSNEFPNCVFARNGLMGAVYLVLHSRFPSEFHHKLVMCVIRFKKRDSQVTVAIAYHAKGNSVAGIVTVTFFKQNPIQIVGVMCSFFF
jgi:hypothetical protein